MKLITTIATDQGTGNGYVIAELTDSGVDGWDTYRWEWGIDSVTGDYVKIEEGEIQHRTDVDGSFKLLYGILAKMGLKL